MDWVVPPPSNSHHQDYYIFSRDPYNPSLATVTGRGDNPRYGYLTCYLDINYEEFVRELWIPVCLSYNYVNYCVNQPICDEQHVSFFSTALFWLVETEQVGEDAHETLEFIMLE